MSEEPTTRVCHHCGATVGRREPCAACVGRIAALPDPATMTPAEREAEFHDYRFLEVPFSVFHERAERLIGRPVWTHEFAQWDRLRTEILSGEHPTFAQVVDKATEVNPNIKVIPVGIDPA